MTFVKDTAGDPLRRNALLLTLTHALGAFLGFVFWAVAARFYPAADIGIGTAAISASGMLVTLSGLGLGFGIIRYLPEERDRSGLINSSVTIPAIISAVLAVVFVAGIPAWAPALGPLRQISIAAVFVLMAVFQSLFSLQTSVFVAFRSAQFTPAQPLIFALRIPLVMLMSTAGVTGICIAFAAAFVVTDAVSFYFITRLLPGYRPVPALRMMAIRKMFRFSLGNYFGDGLRLLPASLLPIVVVNILSPEMGAYFFVAWMIANLLFAVSYYAGLSLVAEGSHRSGDLGGQLARAMKLIGLVLAPGVLVTVFLGGHILMLFGESYATEGLALLRILAVASILVACNELFVGIKRMEKKTGHIIALYGFVAAVTVAGGYLLVGSFGLVGIGLAYLGANIVATIIVLPTIIRCLLHKI